MITDELVRINKDYFVKASSISLKAAIFGALPYLNVPPLNFLVGKLVDWIISKVADGLELGAFFIYIDMRVDQQGKEYVSAAHEANTFQTEESRRKADEAFKRFVKFNIH